MKEKLLFTSLTLFLIALVLLTLCFFIFHFMGSDNKFHKEFHKQTEKPFITNMIGLLSTLLVATSIVTLVVALFVY